VELAPSAAGAAEHLRLAVRCGQAAAVAEHAAAYRTRFPSDPVLLDALAAVAESTGDLVTSRQLLTDLVAAAPGDLRRVVRLAGALRASGDCGAALALFAVERERYRRDPRFHLEEGAAALACQQPRLALLALAEAVRLDPRSASAHERLGATLLQLGQADEAARAFTDCLAVNPTATGCRSGLRRAVAKGARLGE
jgi:tetratricopeptide (TPR) repeat protein